MGRLVPYMHTPSLTLLPWDNKLFVFSTNLEKKYLQINSLFFYEKEPGRII